MLSDSKNEQTLKKIDWRQESQVKHSISHILYRWSGKRHCDIPPKSKMSVIKKYARKMYANL